MLINDLLLILGYVKKASPLKKSLKDISQLPELMIWKQKNMLYVNSQNKGRWE